MTEYRWDTMARVDQELSFGSLVDPGRQIRCKLRSFAPTPTEARITAGMHFRALLTQHNIDWRRSDEPWGDMQDLKEMEE